MWTVSESGHWICESARIFLLFKQKEKITIIILSVHWATTHQNESEISNRVAVLGGHNDAAARKLTATYIQTFLFLLSFFYSSLLYYPASSKYQGSSQPHHEGWYCIRWKVPTKMQHPGKKTLRKIKSHNK